MSAEISFNSRQTSPGNKLPLPVEVRRCASVVALREGMLNRYKELHAEVWPEVLERIEHCNIQNYSIYLRKLADGCHYLFSYFEYKGDDFEADMARMAEHPITQRWWAECVPCLELLPDHTPGEVWAPMKEVFHHD